MRRKSCKHPSEHVVTKFDWAAPYDGDVEWRECLDCGTWLPLGHSDENDERVRVEIRAAELAARSGFGSFSNCGAGCERCGFVTHSHGVVGETPHPQCNERQFHAGYLARQIATHTDGDQ